MQVVALPTIFGPFIAPLEPGCLPDPGGVMKFLCVRNSFALITLAALISVAPASAQTITSATPDSDTTRRQLADFDRFLDSHPEVAGQLRQDPSLINNPKFVENHSELQQYLQQHPEVREEIKENPNAFMNQSQRLDRRDVARDRDITRGELANMDRFL